MGADPSRNVVDSQIGLVLAGLDESQKAVGGDAQGFRQPMHDHHVDLVRGDLALEVLGHCAHGDIHGFAELPL